MDVVVFAAIVGVGVGGGGGGDVVGVVKTFQR